MDYATCCRTRNLAMAEHISGWMVVHDLGVIMRLRSVERDREERRGEEKYNQKQSTEMPVET